MTRTRPPQPQVSVIVPVYNQEQYLEECISSIRRQTLAEWECIIVNDGSSDSSGEIARRFSEEDSRIRCFEQENRTPPAWMASAARKLRHHSRKMPCAHGPLECAALFHCASEGSSPLIRPKKYNPAGHPRIQSEVR